MDIAIPISLRDEMAEPMRTVGPELGVRLVHVMETSKTFSNTSNESSSRQSVESIMQCGEGRFLNRDTCIKERKRSRDLKESRPRDIDE